jgi:hypothetical protein
MLLELIAFFRHAVILRYPSSLSVPLLDRPTFSNFASE